MRIFSPSRSKLLTLSYNRAANSFIPLLSYQRTVIVFLVELDNFGLRYFNFGYFAKKGAIKVLSNGIKERMESFGKF
jgi:hypothetical protein